MDTENNTAEVLPDASQLNAADTTAAVGNGSDTTSAADALSLAEINKSLGKNFPTKDSALKAFKDTFSYVGKKKEDIEKEIKATISNDSKIDQLAKELQVERKERWFDKNPQYADPSVRTLIEKLGGDPREVVESEAFKAVFAKVSEYDKSAKLKTVLDSNPRLSASKDSLTKAREVIQSTGRVNHEVEQLATDAVIQAYGLGK